MSDTKLVLCMIVKNEANILKRCLESVLDIIDAAVITDTGSTDDTVSIIYNTLGPKIDEICVKSDVWEDFGYNRSSNLKSAREFVKSRGWDMEKVYFLLLDADMMLRHHDNEK